MNFSGSKTSIEVPDFDTSKPKKKVRKDKDATSPQPSRPVLPKSKPQNQQMNQGAGRGNRNKPPNFHPSSEIDTMQTIDAADVGNASIDVAEVEDIRPGYYKKKDLKKKMEQPKRVKEPSGRNYKNNYEESKESEHSDDSDIIVPGDKKKKQPQKRQNRQNMSMHIQTAEENLRNMTKANRGSKQPGHTKNIGSQQSSTKNSKQNPKQINSEPEYAQNSSLNERAVKMVGTREYLEKVKQIKDGNIQIKSMEFIMDGIKIELPYNGGKVTQGYLKKEQNTSSLLLSKNWQMRYCILDLTKFVFRYAKAPTDKYTFIHLKDIVDIILEKDPISRQEQKHQGRNSSFFSSGAKKAQNEGFNFILRTSIRDYRLQANTKAEQIAWARAFTILFELRARVSQNLKTTLDIDSHLGITGMNYQNFQKLQATLGEYDYDTINDDNKKYLDNSFEKERQSQASIVSQLDQKNGSVTSPKGVESRQNYQRELVQQHQKAQPKYQLNRNFNTEAQKTLEQNSNKKLNEMKDDPPVVNKLEQQLKENRRREQQRKKQKGNQKFTEDTLVPNDEEDQVSELFGDFGKDNIEVEESLNMTQNAQDHNTRESVFDSRNQNPQTFQKRAKSNNPQTSTQLLIAQKKAALQKEMEANKKLLQATEKLKQFQRLAFSPVKSSEQNNAQSFMEDMQDSIDRKQESIQATGQKDEPMLESIKYLQDLEVEPQVEDEDEYYDEEYDAEDDQSPAKIQTPQKRSPQKQMNANQPNKQKANAIEVSLQNISPQINKKTPLKLQNQKPLHLMEPKKDSSDLMRNFLTDDIKIAETHQKKKFEKAVPRPQTPEQECVEKSVRLDTTLEEYEADGGDRNFKRTVTRAMKIDMSLMQITGKRQGSVIIDFKLFLDDETQMSLGDLENKLDNVLQGDIGYPLLPLKDLEKLNSVKIEAIPKIQKEPSIESIKPDDQIKKFDEIDENNDNLLKKPFAQESEQDDVLESQSNEDQVQIIRPDDLEKITRIQQNNQHQNGLMIVEQMILESEVSDGKSDDDIVQQFRDIDKPVVQQQSEEPGSFEIPEIAVNRIDDELDEYGDQESQEIHEQKQEDIVQQFEIPEIKVDSQKDIVQQFEAAAQSLEEQQEDIVQQFEALESPYEKQDDLVQQFDEPESPRQIQEDIVQQFHAQESPLEQQEDIVNLYNPPQEPIQHYYIEKQENEMSVIDNLQIEELHDFTPMPRVDQTQTPEIYENEILNLQSHQFDMKDLDDMVNIDSNQNEVQRIEDQNLDIVKPVTKPPIKLKSTQVIKFSNKRKLIITSKKNFESTGPVFQQQSKIASAQISRFADSQLNKSQLGFDSQRSSVDARGKIVGACGKSLLRQFAQQKDILDQSVLSGGGLRRSLNATGKSSVFRRNKPRAFNESGVFSEAKDYQELGTADSQKRIPIHAPQTGGVKIRGQSIISNTSNISKKMRLSTQTKSILRQKLKEVQQRKAVDQSNFLNISQDDMVHDISGINHEIAQDESESKQLFNLNKSQQMSAPMNRYKTQAKQVSTDLILEDFEDFNDEFTNLKSPGKKAMVTKFQGDGLQQAANQYFTGVIPQKVKQPKKFEKKSSRDFAQDTSEKKLERQNSRKRNIQYNTSNQISSKRIPKSQMIGEGLIVDEPRITDRQSNPSSNTKSNNGSNPSVTNMGAGQAPISTVPSQLVAPLNANVTNNITNVYNITVVGGDRNPPNEDSANSQIQKKLDYIDKASLDAQDQVNKSDWD